MFPLIFKNRHKVSTINGSITITNRILFYYDIEIGPLEENSITSTTRNTIGCKLSNVKIRKVTG